MSTSTEQGIGMDGLLSLTKRLSIGILEATLPGAWRYRVSARASLPSVIIM